MRRGPPTLPEVAALFRRFGDIDLVARLRLCNTRDEQLKAFEAARSEAKIHHRRLALQHHPDRGGDAEKLKAINAAWTQLQKLKLAPRQPMRKSALNVSEARGAGHTSVFVGMYQEAQGPTVSWDNASSASSITREEFVRMMRDLSGGR